MILKLSLLTSLISFNSFAEIKTSICSASISGVKTKLTIVHDTSDFTSNREVLNSSVKLEAANVSYYFDSKKLSSNGRTIDFKTRKTPPYLGKTQYLIADMFIYDAYPNEDSDDYFFGRIKHAGTAQTMYLTDFDRMGGDLVVLFICNRLESIENFL